MSTHPPLPAGYFSTGALEGLLGPAGSYVIPARALMAFMGSAFGPAMETRWFVIVQVAHLNDNLELPVLPSGVERRECQVVHVGGRWRRLITHVYGRADYDNEGRTIIQPHDEEMPFMVPMGALVMVPVSPSYHLNRETLATRAWGLSHTIIDGSYFPAAKAPEFALDLPSGLRTIGAFPAAALPFVGGHLRANFEADGIQAVVFPKPYDGAERFAAAMARGQAHVFNEPNLGLMVVFHGTVTVRRGRVIARTSSMERGVRIPPDAILVDGGARPFAGPREAQLLTRFWRTGSLHAPEPPALRTFISVVYDRADGGDKEYELTIVEAADFPRLTPEELADFKLVIMRVVIIPGGSTEIRDRVIGQPEGVAARTDAGALIFAMPGSVSQAPAGPVQFWPYAAPGEGRTQPVDLPAGAIILTGFGVLRRDNSCEMAAGWFAEHGTTAAV